MDDGLFLGAPPGHTWPLTAATLETLLRQRHPQAPIRLTTSGVTAAATLDFEIPLADGDSYGGSYSETGVLALVGGTPQLWADTMTWFLTFLPGNEPVYAMREDNPFPAELPSGTRSDPAALAAFFGTLTP